MKALLCVRPLGNISFFGVIRGGGHSLGSFVALILDGEACVLFCFLFFLFCFSHTNTRVREQEEAVAPTVGAKHLRYGSQRGD